MSTTRSLVIVTVAYVVAIGVAAAWLAWGPATGRLWLDTFIADLLATLVIRRPAYQDVVDRVSRFVPRPPKAVS